MPEIGDAVKSIVDVVRDQCRCGGFCEDGLVCESHPWLGWPHDDCGAPGMPCSQPIRDPLAVPLTRETFVSREDVDAVGGDLGAHVRSLGLKPEEWEAVKEFDPAGWTLVKRCSPRWPHARGLRPTVRACTGAPDNPLIPGPSASEFILA